MYQNDLITRQEAASLLRVSLRTLDNLIERGQMPRPVRLGGRRLFFHREQLDVWIRRQFGLTGPTDPPGKPSGEKRRRGRPRSPSTDAVDTE